MFGYTRQILLLMDIHIGVLHMFPAYLKGKGAIFTVMSPFKDAILTPKCLFMDDWGAFHTPVGLLSTRIVLGHIYLVF